MYYGFDIGGTKIAFAVYDGALNLCHEERMSTRAMIMRGCSC